MLRCKHGLKASQEHELIAANASSLCECARVGSWKRMVVGMIMGDCEKKRITRLQLAREIFLQIH
jgi:hypothetical protein